MRARTPHMPRPPWFLPQLRLTWNEELRQLAQQMQSVSSRLGTPAERDDDLATARALGARVKTLQLALAGLGALHQERTVRPRRVIRPKAPLEVVSPTLERHIA